MNNTATPTIRHTPLESALLYYELLKGGYSRSTFDAIATLLSNNEFVQQDPTYDAARLTSEALQELFLDLLWKELQTEQEQNAATPGPDGSLSPASKRRRLQPPPRPTLQSAVVHIDTIGRLWAALQDRYYESVQKEIQEGYEREDVLREEIRQLEELEAAERAAGQAHNHATGAVTSNGVSGPSTASASSTAALTNGTSPSSTPDPRLTIPSTTPQDVRNGLVPAEQTTVSRPTPPTSAPTVVQPPPAPPSTPSPSPQLAQGSPRVPAANLQEPPKQPNGSAQVLQAPQGLPQYAPHTAPSASQSPAEGLQRPDGVPRPRQSPVLGQQQGFGQPPAQGQLKWEPPYQPPQASPRLQQPSPVPALHQNYQNLARGAPHPQGQATPPQWNPQAAAAQSSPRVVQPHPPSHFPQPGTQHPQQVLVPPQNTGVYVPRIQPAGTPGPGRVQPGAPGPASGRHQAGPQTSHPGYQHPSQNRPLAAASPAVPANAGSLPPVGSGLAQPQSAPHQARQTPSLQAPAGYMLPQQHIPQLPHQQSLGQHQPLALQAQQHAAGSPSTLAAQSGYSTPTLAAQSGYSTPRQLPQAQAQSQPPHPIPSHLLTQRLAAATPPPPIRTSSIAPAPQTPLSANLPYINSGRRTKWQTARTPSTPVGTPGFAPGTSPAFEPLSPVLAPAAPSASQPATPLPALDQTPQKAEGESVKPPPKRKGRPPKNKPQGDATSPPAPTPKTGLKQSGPPGGSPSKGPGASPSAAPAVLSVEPTAASPVEDSSLKEPGSARIKDEEATPRPLADTGDTTADESAAGPRRTSRASKRKRRTSSPTPMQHSLEPPMEETPADTPTDTTMDHLPHTKPNEVAWTRAFNKISGSAMEQIVHHRHANMFANPIRERDAPGYHNYILQPQDLKSIRAAISHGNKAAAQAAAALPNGDPGTSGVTLPVNEEIMPPRGIINIKQLDRELSHIFANAIMYNPDSGHGPGNHFLRREVLLGSDAADEDGEAGASGGASGTSGSGHFGDGGPTLGYKVDEFGVVNDARAMHTVVNQLIGELASPKVERLTRPPPPVALGTGTGPGTGTSTRHASVATPATAGGYAGGGGGERSSVARDEREGTMGDEEHTATEAENGGHVAKRRRTTRKGGE